MSGKFCPGGDFFAQFEIPFHTPVTAGNKKLDISWVSRSSLERYIDFKLEKVGKD